MADQDAEARLRRQAERRVGAKIGFYIHAAVYAIVNTGLVGVNLFTTPQTLWFVWPLAGWGIGLFMHGFGVFFSLSGAREKAVEAEMERLRNRTGPSS